MTLYSFSSADAQRNVRRTRHSIWPDGRRRNEDRLVGLATVQPTPTFTLDKSDKLMTIGSCFAREIEKFLDSLGFDLPALDVVIPAEERVSKTDNDILNKYTVHSMENEIRWGFGELDIPDEDFFLRASEDTWHDAQLVHNLIPASLDRVKERRKQVSKMMGRLAECRVTVITLGLVEAWFDTKTQLYLNGIPPAYAMKEEPERFELRVLDYDEITESLDRIYALHEQFGHPDFKILVTVSPVPFKATMTGRDAIVANTYGKSVQRAAAELFSSKHDNVNYFPSYEIVTLSDRKLAYEEDNIHVTRPTVQHIMSTVLAAYVPDFKAKPKKSEPIPAARQATAANLMAAAISSLKSDDPQMAITQLTSLIYRFGSKLPTERLVRAHRVLAVSFLRANENAAAAEHLDTALALAPEDADLWFKFGLVCGRLKKRDDALEAFRKAVQIESENAEYQYRLGAQLKYMGRPDEAVPYFEKALQLDPTHKGAISAVEVTQTAQ